MARSEAYVSQRQAEIAVFLTSVISAGLVIFFGWVADASYWFSVPVGVLFGVLAFMCSAILLGTAPRYFDSRREDELINEYRGTDRQLGLLAELNRQEMLRYHDIVTKQAGQSFRQDGVRSGSRSFGPMNATSSSVTACGASPSPSGPSSGCRTRSRMIPPSPSLTAPACG